MSLITPWILADADVALWPAWKDGLPFHGPGEGRGRPASLFACKASLRLAEDFTAGSDTGHGWAGAEMATGSSYQVTIDFPEGALADDFSREMSRLPAGGFRILTVRLLDEPTGHWTLLTLLHVTPAGDSAGGNVGTFDRSVTFNAGWLQERTGHGDLPGMEPVVHGEVDWLCGSQRVTALRYDPVDEIWTSTPQNETGAAGESGRYVTFTPVGEDPGADVILAYFLPRLEAAPVAGTLLPGNRVRWQNTLALRVGNHASESHHGLVLSGGHSLQAVGIVEPLVRLAQDRMLDEPVLVFRYGRRIYATLGHGVLAVPKLETNEAPPLSHDPAFRLAVPGPLNPVTGCSGLVLLPHGAWLDGTLLTQP